MEGQFVPRLFDRTHNRVTLTEAGQVVYEYSEKIFDLYSEMENAIREMTDDISGSLTIGASTTISEYMLPSLLGDFKSKNADIKLRLRVSNTEGIVSMVENNVIDLGVVEGPVTNKNLLVEVCRTDEMVLICPPSHELAKLDKVTAKDLVKYSLICREEGSGTREVMVDYLSIQGVDKHAVNNCLELGSPEAVKGAVEAGMGVSVVSSASISKEIKLGSLVSKPLNPPLTRDFSFVRQRQKFKVPAMEELLEFARIYCQRAKKTDE